MISWLFNEAQIDRYSNSSVKISLFVGFVQPEGIKDEVEGEQVKEEESDESDTADELEDEEDDDEEPAYAIEKMRSKITISEARIADFQGMFIPQTYTHSFRRT